MGIDTGGFDANAFADNMNNMVGTGGTAMGGDNFGAGSATGKDFGTGGNNYSGDFGTEGFVIQIMVTQE